MPDSLWPHWHQVRHPYPSVSPGIYSVSWPLSQWYLPTISSSVILFSSCPHSFLASGSFPMSQFFASSGQSVGASASASVPSVNIQGWFRLGLTDLVSLLSKRLSRAFFSITIWQKYLTWCKYLQTTLLCVYGYYGIMGINLTCLLDYFVNNLLFQ